MEDAVILLLVKESTHKALLGIEKKPSKMEDDEWNNIDFCANVVKKSYLDEHMAFQV